jgi:NADH-quinone oxidoreductase subunit C
MADDTTTAPGTTEEAATEEEAVETDETREQLLAGFTDALGDAVVDSHILPGKDLWIRVASDAWAETAEVARNRLGARYFCFLSAIDWMPSPYGRSMDSEVDRQLSGDAAQAAEVAELQQGFAGGETRFQVFGRLSHVGDPGKTWGVTLKTDVPEETMGVPTWTRVYAGADWHEREAWEMFGITFLGHPGLRNIYLPSDFEGNPLRKDFPLLSRMVKPWPGIVDVEQFPEDEQSPEDEQGPDEGGGEGAAGESSEANEGDAS